MSMQDKLIQIRDALTSVPGLLVYHYFTPSEAKAPYLVWKEENEDSSKYSDNHKTDQTSVGYIDLFTQTEFDPLFDAVQEALEGIDSLSWTWESTIYGDPQNEDDNLIHFTWSWRML